MKTKQARNIDEYIADFPKDVQERMQKVRATIKKAAPDAELRKAQFRKGSLTQRRKGTKKSRQELNDKSGIKSAFICGLILPLHLLTV